VIDENPGDGCITRDADIDDEDVTHSMLPWLFDTIYQCGIGACSFAT
jgi:hypothetical protein